MTGPPNLDAATLRQVEAADPTASTWLSANAGSGKTRVLTDRVARLLLAGTPPQNVLCLTYTKAAASEMQNRLFQRLGGWAMLNDAELSAKLGLLGVEGAAGPDVLAEARRLFARAIETPGGLKIQTIHSFCAAVLRRFPLEAGISPGFREMDDIAAKRLQSEVLSELALRDPDVFAGMAALVSDEDFGPLCTDLQRHRSAFPDAPTWEDTCASFGVDPDTNEGTLRGDALAGVAAGDLRDMAAVLVGESKTMQALAGILTDVAGNVTQESYAALRKACLYADRLEPKPSALTKGARAALGDLAEMFDEMAERIASAEEAARALEAARRTFAVRRFAAEFLPSYARAKAARGLLDFDDLIELTERLLGDPAVADWVLYRLDGGIDHVLVDEAQDTSPRQWRVIEHLTREFTAGEGAARPGERTIFVVGDLKQSIYSFQGADPESFGRMRQSFAERLAQVGARLVELPLEYSFRSAPEILRVVDETFHENNREGLGDTSNHLAFKQELPGRVELWPPIEKAEKEEDGDWWDPVDRLGAEHHTAQLAARVADAARGMVDRARIMGKDGPRAVTAGDILILVQSRGALFHEIIRTCKARGLDVAGADVLKLTEELAVKDITALLSFLDTPEDDLSLAAVLRSPLCGWSEGQLYDLAAGRGERYLWQALRTRAADCPDTHAMLSDLRQQADFLRPYELIDRILSKHDGRRRLIARLGSEAADGIDALLARALAHEQAQVPGLTGFLAAQESQQANLKRQAEGRGAKLRVMTVHGAKGLESPIVILPDTVAQRRMRQYTDKLVPSEDGPLWSMGKGEAPARMTELREAAVARQVAESRRLLYVAMTRAEQWLVVAAAGELGKQGDTWYEQVREGLQRAGAEPDGTHGEGGLLYQAASWPSETVRAEAEPAPPSPPPLPDWTRAAAATPPRPERTLAPSELGGAKALPGDAGIPEDEAMARGTRIHLLLEHLPKHDPAVWPRIAEALVAPLPCPPDELAEARAVLEAEALAPLFTAEALAEVPVTAPLAALGGRRIHGTIDRLVITQERVLAVDFKTNATVPCRVEDVPEGLLRQMGAYLSALALIWPDRNVETAILWTRSATLMSVPADLAAAALVRAQAQVQANGEVTEAAVTQAPS